MPTNQRPHTQGETCLLLCFLMCKGRNSRGILVAARKHAHAPSGISTLRWMLLQRLLGDEMLLCVLLRMRVLHLRVLPTHPRRIVSACLWRIAIATITCRELAWLLRVARAWPWVSAATRVLHLFLAKTFFAFNCTESDSGVPEADQNIAISLS